MIPAPADPTLMLVAADHRLSGLGVFTHAKPLVMLVMALLLAAIVVAAAVWVRALAAGPRAEASRSATATLSGIAAAAPLLGLFAAAYGLMDSCIGLANVRPVPSLSVLAPGLAEAFMAIALGMLAAAVATLGRHHLKARMLAVTTTESGRTPAPAAMPREAWPA
jgi:biopolymer transport protein ExbB/TolQ